MTEKADWITDDYYCRVTAIDKALQLPGVTPEGAEFLVKQAKIIEAYLRGEADQT